MSSLSFLVQHQPYFQSVYISVLQELGPSLWGTELEGLEILSYVIAE